MRFEFVTDKSKFNKFREITGEERVEILEHKEKYARR